jgi:hypothetical protein
MLINLLARLEHVVNVVELNCPAQVPLQDQVVPLAQSDHLGTRLFDAAAEIDVVPVQEKVGGECDLELVVGIGEARPEAPRVVGNGWIGGLVEGPLISGVTSELPVGPYLAACFAAGYVFSRARLHEIELQPVLYCAWREQVVDGLDAVGPDRVRLDLPDSALAGVGAVGAAFLHALWAWPDLTGKLLIADNDAKGIDATNLNRTITFARRHVGHPKASTAHAILSGGALELDSEDKSIRELDPLPPVLVSAVDTNRSRRTIQQAYPARLFSASTRDLRAEVLRCGPPGQGPCLSCFNEPERLIPDDELHRRLRAASAEELAGLAKEAGVSLTDAKLFQERGGCAEAGARLISQLRDEEAPTEFAVGFVSALAGALLAGELVKESLGAHGPLDADYPRAAVQFFNPAASTGASRFRRQPDCPMCDPAEPAAEIWAERFGAFAPTPH